MREVSIYSIGGCDAGTRIGYCETVLEYEGRTKYLRMDLTDTTANRCIIQGLINGVVALKEACNVKLITSTPAGVQKGMKGEGVNADLILKLIGELTRKGCMYAFDARVDQGDVLRRFIRNVQLKAQQSK